MGWNAFSGYGLMGGFFGFFFMILSWGLIIWGVVSFVQWISRQETAEKKGPAMTIWRSATQKGKLPKKNLKKRKKILLHDSKL